MMPLTCTLQKLRLASPYATWQTEIQTRETLIVRFDHSGVIGLGEIVPTELTGESLPACEAAVASMEALVAEVPTDPSALVQRLLDRCGLRAAVAGVETAIHDWNAKRAGVPLWHMLGLSRPDVATAVSIGVADQAETMSRVSDAMDAGHESLRVNVGVSTDHETLSVIRSVFRGDVFLDSGGAWPGPQAEARMRALARYNPAAVIQPAPSTDVMAHAAARALGVAPIYTNEIRTDADGASVLAKSFDGVAISLHQCGGILETMRVTRAAREAGLKTLLVGSISSSLAIAPALALAQLADAVCLDGALLLEEDPCAGITRSAGRLSLDDAPGCGVSLRS